MSREAQASLAAPQPASMFTAHAAEKQRTTLPEDREHEARQCLDAVEQLKEFRRRGMLRTDTGRKITNLKEVAEYIGTRHQPKSVSGRTVRRWEAWFDEEGLVGLARGLNKNKGVSTFFSAYPKAVLFVLKKRLETSNERLITEALAREWPTFGYPGAPCCEDTVRNYLEKKFWRPVSTLVDEGPRALYSKHSGFIVRKLPPVMDWWIADHRVFDFPVRNTMFAHLKPDQSFRLWGTFIYDWGSHFIVGYCFAPTPSSDTINSALRTALSQFGFPKHFYWDNGKDFKKVAGKLQEIVVSEAGRALLLQNSIEFGITQTLPMHPRSKPIEAYFTRFSKRFDPLVPGYRGNSTRKRPESAAVVDRAHDDYLKEKRDDSPVKTDRDLIIAAAQWIAEYNEQARLESLDDRTPAEVFDEQAPSELRKPVPRRVLDVLLMKDDKRTVLSGGCVEICKMRYEPKPEFIGPLFLAQEKRVLILRDPYHFEEAVAVDPDTHEFIGELALIRRIEQNPDSQVTRDQVRTKLRMQRALERACRDYVGAIVAGASSYGWQTEFEALRSRAEARFAMTGTEGRPALPAGAAPGAVEPHRTDTAAAVRHPALAPAFVSDGPDLDISKLELED